MKHFINILLSFCLLLPISGNATNLWKRSDATAPKRATLVAGAAQTNYLLDEAALAKALRNLAYDPSAAQIITLPMPNGKMMDFKVWQTSVLPEPLAAKYPELSTYSAIAVPTPTITAKLDITVYGFHAMVFDGAHTYFVDKSDNSTYLAHYKRDERKPSAQQMRCAVPGHQYTDIAAMERNKRVYRTANGYQLHSYRLALACDHQYAHAVTGESNPTKAQVLSKMLTTVNRINGVYERELSVSFTLVTNEDTLIFTDSLHDPFGHDDQNAPVLLSENQHICDSLIGTANYDIGHIFTTGGGGLSQIACVCQADLKAQSVTGSANPSGDGFDIDYVAHEMGHEMGSEHTFNNNIDGSCSGNAVEECAFQPGSGSTIMDYAGICSHDDIQPHSDAYFSGSSLLQIYQCITTTGTTCAETTATGNKPAGIDGFTASYAIPFLTPFELTAPAATDSVTDTLTTYCWEQWNLGDFGQELKHTFYSGPIFRSFAPTTSTTRIFPNMVMVLADSLSNAGTENAEGEKAPDVARYLTFRLSVRDMMNGYGAFLIPDDTVHLDVINTGTGFRVTSQTSNGAEYIGTAEENVTWDVAQTNIAPINCSTVDIYLSGDGGNTWNYNLGNYPNTGSATVTIPNITLPHARIKVKGTGNVFFNVNKADFGTLYYPGHTGNPLLFPDPAHDVLHVFTGAAGTVQAGIYDGVGKRVWEGTITDILELNISDYPRGMYFMNMKDNEGKSTIGKFVVW